MSMLTIAERKSIAVEGRKLAMQECLRNYPANAEWHRERIAEIEAMTDAEYESFEQERWDRIGLGYLSPVKMPLKKVA